jgi:hypothetical protein
MKPYDFSQYDDAACGLVTGVYDLKELALHLRRRLGHARRFYRVTGEGSQT